MTQDFSNTPYRLTPAYARAVEAAKRQKAQIHHRAGELHPYQSRPTAAAVMRRPWYGFAR